MSIKTTIYKTSTGIEPFSKWFLNLDPTNRYIVTTRLKRVGLGNFGDCKIIKGGDGIWELRIDYGPGYRIYFGKQGSEIIVLLVGGDKGSQEQGITKAKRYWLDYRELKK